jgi:hypothetical protein
MPARGSSLVITYMAWDFVNQAGKTGDVANHTLRLMRDGEETVPTNSPSEVNTNTIPGMYKLTVTAAEADCLLLVVGGKSSTSGVSIVPFEITLTE